MNRKIPLAIIALSFACIAGYIYSSQYYTGFTTAIFAFSLTFSILLLLLIFLNYKIFNGWIKFGIFFFIISAGIIAITPEYGSGALGLDLSPDRKMVAWWMAGIFFVISLVIIGVQSLRLRNK